MSRPLAENGFADFACVDCRRLKRKCTRDLPSCTLCSKVGRPCDYQDPSSISPVENGRSSNGRSTTITPTLPSTFSQDVAPRTYDGAHSSRSLTKSFLDSVVTRGTTVSRPVAVAWREISTLPSPSKAEAISIVEQHFDSTHHWLPVVSRKRLLRHFQWMDDLRAADDVILVLSMSLLDQPQQSPTIIQRYHAIKAALQACEHISLITPNVLAANILLATYELCQAIYPAAYLSVSHCARLFYATGLHNKKHSTLLIHEPDTWTEMEEQRRLWWAVILLDRYIHIGFRFRPLCVHSIPASEILPAHDSAWDEGELTVNSLLIMSIEAQTSVSPYARTCQAAHLLGKVIEHVNDHASASDVDLHLQEAMQILRAIKALKVMVEGEISLHVGDVHRLYTSKALCLSALMLMYDTHGCIEGSYLDSSGVSRGLRLKLQQLSIDGCKEMASEVVAFTKELKTCPGGQVTPFALYCIYSAAGTWAWLYRETGNESAFEALQELKGVLTHFSQRWRVAGEYLDLLDGAEHVDPAN